MEEAQQISDAMRILGRRSWEKRKSPKEIERLRNLNKSGKKVAK